MRTAAHKANATGLAIDTATSHVPADTRHRSRRTQPLQIIPESLTAGSSTAQASLARTRELGHMRLLIRTAKHGSEGIGGKSHVHPTHSDYKEASHANRPMHVPATPTTKTSLTGQPQQERRVDRTNSERDAHYWDGKRIRKETHIFLHPTKALPSRKFHYFLKIRFESRKGHRVVAIWSTAVRMGMQSRSG